MALSFDLHALPLYRRDGQDYSYLPGFHAAEAPRRAARGRSDERLLILLHFQGDLDLSRSQIDKLVEDLSEGYFSTPGSATSALRSQAERLNAYVLEHNQSNPGGEPARALLAMAVLREERVLLAKSGPLHGFLLDGPRIEHFYDPQGAGRGLGLAQSTDIRFFQTELQLGAVLLVLPRVPGGWNQNTLVGIHGQNLASLRRRFLSQAGTDLTAALVATQPGQGAFHVLSGPEALQVIEGDEQPEEADSPAVDEAAPAPEPPRAPVERDQDGRAWEPVDVPGDEEPEPIEEPPVQSPAVKPQPRPQPEPEEQEAAMAWDDQEDQDDEPSTLSLLLGAIGEVWGNLTRRILPPLRSLLLRLLPEESSLNLPSSTMAIIAVVVPVVVVVIVSLVYLQVGRGQLLANYLEQAQSAAAAAEAREDPTEVRQAWELSLYYAQQAEEYQEEEEATTLRLQAQAALDDFDAIERLDFQPALFEDLPEGAEIDRLVATNTELYMLNRADGSILRAFLTGGGYEIDEAFRCGPGPYGGFIVSPLVDLALLPRENDQGAALAAIDANGNLIYCLVDGSPLAVQLATPASNWGQPQAIDIANGNLYVLDPLTNAVWIYFGEDYAFAEEPRFYFAEEVPNLGNAIDIAVREDSLYILDLDGEVAVCAFSDDADNPTTCQDPLDYTDTRPGRSSGPSVEGAHFLQLQVTEPPEPSTFMVDPIAQAVYQFSLRLNLVRQYRSSSELPQAVASAFAVSPNRALFVAFDNQVYIAFLP